ncbi:MAG TPA: DUF5670 family protein [Candidatus Saccharimonadales bacterium]|nr:DUF5670 family protein [Candidatus Saccharimonadales bacterium]
MDRELIPFSVAVRAPAVYAEAMLLTIVAILVLIWLLGVFLHFLGAFIYLALVVAAIVFVYDVLVVRPRERKRDK